MNTDEFYHEKNFSNIEEEISWKEALIKNGDIIGEVIKAINRFLPSPKSILDVGGGSGVNLLLCKKYTKASELYCLDIRDPPNKLPEINYIKSPIEKFGDLDLSKFDVIMMTEVIEHLFDPDSAIESLKKKLDNDGIIIITTPNPSGLLNILVLFLGYQPPDTEVSVFKAYGRPMRRDSGEVVGHIHVFTMRALQEMLLNHGLKILLLKSYGMVFAGDESFRLRFASLIDRTASHIASRGGSRMLAVVKRSDSK